VPLVAIAGCIPDNDPATGGTPVMANAADGKKCPPDGVIDDGEDNNNQVAPNKGRSGYWYVFLDKVGTTITPAAGGTFSMSKGGANGSAYAAHVNGKIGNGTVVYGGVGFNFVDPKGAYDASAYKGISFWAKVGEGSATKIRLKVPDGDTDPDGKVCTECFNDFGTDLTLTTTWTKYTVSFSQMAQMQGWGAPHPAAIDPKKLFGVQWQVNTPGSNYDLWVDEVEFTGCP
jgi:hypothetical protein